MGERRHAVFVLSHGRADTLSTVGVLRKCGYTGPLYVLVDDEDDQLERYRQRFGDSVVVFHKDDYVSRCDTVDNFGIRRCVLFARVAVFDVARSMGYTHFQMFDDDVRSIEWRWPEDGVARVLPVSDYDSVMEALLDFLDKSGALSVALAQGGDFIGGAGSSAMASQFLRKCMNTFICRSDRPIRFKGTMNEDVAAYTLHGMRGDLMLTITAVSVVMGATQVNRGGMAEEYITAGAWQKPAYSLVTSPSCVRVRWLADHSHGVDRVGRIHHNVIHRKAYAQIVRDQ